MRASSRDNSGSNPRKENAPEGQWRPLTQILRTTRGCSAAIRRAIGFANRQRSPDRTEKEEVEPEPNKITDERTPQDAPPPPPKWGRARSPPTGQTPKRSGALVALQNSNPPRISNSDSGEIRGRRTGYSVSDTELAANSSIANPRRKPNVAFVIRYVCLPSVCQSLKEFPPPKKT